MHLPRPLLVITLAYGVLIILYAALVPPWETPDEPAHYRYLTELAGRWRPPNDPGIRQTDRFCKDYAFTTSNYEWYHPALGYLPLAVVYRILQLLVPRSLPAEIPLFNPLFCPDPFAYPNLFRAEAPHPFKIWEHQWGLLILRWTSALWGLVVIIATYRIGRSLGMDGFEVVAAAWVAFLPQFSFISASVRNDTLNNAISALLFLLAVEMQLSWKHRNRLAWLMGLTLGIGLLTKLTSVYLIPVALLAAILPPSSSTKEQIRLTIQIIATSIIITALYYLLYPEARAALAYTKAQMEIKPQSLSWTYWKPFFPLLIDLFFARFGWANIPVPSWWIQIAFGEWILGMILSLYHMVRSLRRWRESSHIRILFLLLFGLCLAFVGVIRYNFSHFQPQGRFLFPALVSCALLGTWGLGATLPKPARFWIGLGIVSFMLLFNLRALATIVSAYY